MNVKIIRVLNTNAVVSVDSQGRELIMTGPGIGFKKRKGENIDQSLVDKTYHLENKEESKRLQEVVKEISEEYLGIADRVVKEAKKEKLELYKISSVTGEGIEKLIDYVSEVLKTLPKEELVEIEDKVVYTLQDKGQEWEAYEEDGIFYVKGRAVDRLMGRINIEDNESMYYLQKSLKNMGIEDKLKELGVCEGDTVKISDWELEWYE